MSATACSSTRLNRTLSGFAAKQSSGQDFRPFASMINPPMFTVEQPKAATGVALLESLVACHGATDN